MIHEIVGVQFSILSNEEKNRIADVDVSAAGTKSNANALYDPRLGPIEQGSSCFECQKNNIECSGHWAKINFGAVFPHPYFIDEIKQAV